MNLIIANGDIPSKAFVLNHVNAADRVIATDGGANHCLAMGITPDLVVGDMDSISAAAKKAFADRLQPDSDQHTTDLQKGLALCGDDTIVLGGLNDRMDHALANILSLRPGVRLVDTRNEILLVDQPLEIDGDIGDIVSVFAKTAVKGLTYEGLKFAVKDLDVPAGWIGSSNELSETTGRISFTTGELIIIKVTL